MSTKLYSSSACHRIMLDTSLIATVAAVVREGSFERAARVLHIAPSAVSQRIRLIEDKVGAVLIVRGQPCTATDIGMRLCRHAETVLLLENELRHTLPLAFAADEKRLRSSLRIVVNADSLATWFVSAVANFTAVSDVLIEVTVDDQDQTEEWLRRGHAVAAVTSQSRAVQGFRARRLGSLTYAAVASPEFVARWFSQGVTADSLSRAPSLVFDQKDRLQERWARRVLRREVTLPAHRLPSSAAFVEATVRGVGWALNPRPMVERQLQDGTLVELIPNRALDVPLYWQWSSMSAPIVEQLTQEVLNAASITLTK
jgi:LysR family transcriptional regulator, chromosome initiation inhibitor